PESVSDRSQKNRVLPRYSGETAWNWRFPPGTIIQFVPPGSWLMESQKSGDRPDVQQRDAYPQVPAPPSHRHDGGCASGHDPAPDTINGAGVLLLRYRCAADSAGTSTPRRCSQKTCCFYHPNATPEYLLQRRERRHWDLRRTAARNPVRYRKTVR